MKTISVWIVFFIPFNVFSQTLAQKIKSKYQTFASLSNLKNASYSLSVLNTQTGKIVFAANQNMGLAPASTLKTVTSATALQLLGSNFTFKTQVAYTGEIVNHTLNGNLIITGNGDPTLGSNRWDKTNKPTILKTILNAIVTAGIKNINGKIIANDMVWDTQSLPDGWLWQDIGNYYGAQTSALCWGENMFELNVLPSKLIKSPVTINNNATYPFLKIENEVVTGQAQSGDNMFGYSAPYSNTIYLRGTYDINLKKDIGLSLPDPAYALAYDVHTYLSQNDITVSNFTTSRLLGLGFQNPAKAVNIATITSPPLSQIVYQLNQNSINLYAEQIIRTLALQKNKKALMPDGLNIVKSYWQTLKIEPEALHIYDGSGLSPANRVSTLAMAMVLRQAHNSAWFTEFYKSLPTHNNMVMKSGLIADVLAYAGYQKNPEGDLCFSVMVNNFSGSESVMRQQLYVLLNALK
ncbi:MAG: D-alanyl-D-alanine carboxypeptidase/D-alanyl-D-alanine-endopeptidase [Sphingobacteriales bacterium]|nr:MAG: D-alanyl-D-alanine carboxypeptidase/D-alanyl-D-alanine-endopeptidase [Sphingobacteriales bacterium]